MIVQQLLVVQHEVVVVVVLDLRLDVQLDLVVQVLEENLDPDYQFDVVHVPDESLDPNDQLDVVHVLHHRKLVLLVVAATLRR